MSANVTHLRTPIHQPDRVEKPIRPLSGAQLEAYIDLCTIREDWDEIEKARRKDLETAKALHEEARAAIERIDGQLAAINRQRGVY